MITLILLAIQTTLNITGAQVMGRVAQFGVYVEILGTFGIALILAIHGFHHGLGFLFSTQGVENAATNPLSLDFHGSWLTARRSSPCSRRSTSSTASSRPATSPRRPRTPGAQVPRAMRLALIWGGIASLS